MKKLIISLALLVSSVAAFAIPSPKQIEHQLQVGNVALARSMVNEVLTEQPGSARAHLLNAYTIVKLEKDAAMAEKELQLAASLDRKGDVTSSPLYRKVSAEIQNLKAPPAYAPPQVATLPPAIVHYESPESSGFGKFFVFLLLVSAAAVGFVFWRRSKAEIEAGADTSTTVTPTSSVYRPPQPTGYSSQSYRAATVSRPAPAPYQPAPAPYQPVQTVQNTGPSILGTAGAVVGGVVVGNMISDSLRHSSHHDEVTERRKREVSDEPSLGAFSSGTDAAWEPPVTAAPAPSSFSSSRDDDWAPAPSPAPSSFSSSRDDDWAPAPSPEPSSSSDDNNSW